MFAFISSLISVSSSLLLLLFLPAVATSDVTHVSELIRGTWDDIHIVFTTGCSGYQNWQSENLLYSWARVQHPGRITRVIAGCKNDAERLLANTTAVPNDDGRILWFFVKDFGAEHKFKYFNKPYGFSTWIQNEWDNIYENVIALVDPDMILLRPLLFHIESESRKWTEWQHENTRDKNDGKVRDMFVREGHPVSQRYGIQGVWTPWLKKENATNSSFCDDNPSCNVRLLEARKYYSVGPPYIMHKSDWKMLAPKWLELSPLALKYDPPPSILAEMHSYAMACAFYDLKHEYIYSMVSNAKINPEEENIENLDWSFLESETMGTNHQFHILHYCQWYVLSIKKDDMKTASIRKGGWSWHKGHMPKDLMYDCEIPLLVELPEQLMDVHFFEILKERDHTEFKGSYWILYHLMKYTNQAVINYRLQYCDESSRKNLVHRLALQPSDADETQSNIWNYVLGNYSKDNNWISNKDDK